MSLALGGDEGSGSRSQQGDTVRDTGQVCEQDGASLDCRVEKEGCVFTTPSEAAWLEALPCTLRDLCMIISQRKKCPTLRLD